MGLFGKKVITKPFFVCSYGNKQTRGIYTFQLDIDSGKIFFKQYFSTPTDPTYAFTYGRFVCISYKNKTGQGSDGGINSYAATCELLALSSRLANNGKTYMHACTNGDDDVATKLYGADYANGEIMVAKIEKKKLIAAYGDYKLEGSSVDPIRQASSHPSYVTMTPDLQKVVVSDLGSDKVSVFNETEKSIELDEANSFTVEAGSGPTKLLFNKAGNKAYLINELNSTINVYDYQDHHFTLIQTVDTFEKDKYDDDNLATNMLFNDDETRLFVTNSGHDSLALFLVDQETGKLEFKDFIDTSPNPVDLILIQNRWIAVICRKGGIVESYEYRDERGGMLFETKYFYLINEPVCITKFVDNKL